jgi:hypothetical protein
MGVINGRILTSPYRRSPRMFPSKVNHSSTLSMNRLSTSEAVIVSNFNWLENEPFNNFTDQKLLKAF